MNKLIVKVKTSNGKRYLNWVNAEDYKNLALIFSDLAALGINVDKAFNEYKLSKKSDWDLMIGS